MLIEMFTVDFESSEAIYMQLRNQIILGIATAQIREGGYASFCAPDGERHRN